MMNHEAYRRTLLADPRSDDAELRSHREVCPECRAYAEGVLRFESRLERALKLNVAGPAARLRPGRLALAASVLLALLAGGVWLAAPRASLAAAVVTHVVDEPQSWVPQGAVADPKLAAVLRDVHMHLKGEAGAVSYASSCEFRGHVVPHMVVQTAQGPVTVMVLVHEAAAKEVQFDERGYRGVIVPVAGHGSIALLTRDSDARINVEEVAARVREAIVWSP